jgi:serine phosphatase RsbU (regulator of sigma subunit)
MKTIFKTFFLRSLLILTILFLLLIKQTIMAQAQTKKYNLDTLQKYGVEYPDSILPILAACISDAEKGKDFFTAALGHEARGYIFLENEEYRKSIQEYQEAYKDLIRSDSLYYISGVLVELGINLNYLGELDSALNYYYKAEANAREYANLTTLSQTYRSIGLLKIDLGDYKSALNYLFQCLELVDDIKSGKNQRAEILQNIGIAYSKMDSLNEAINFYGESLQIFIEMNNMVNTAISYNNIGVLYERQENLDSTLHYYAKALEMFEKLDYKLGVSITLSNIGFIHRKRNEFDSALAYTHKSLDISKQIDLNNQILSSYNELALVYSGKGDYEKAFHYSDSAYYLNDSINSQEQNEYIAELETIYETEKKEQQIALQQTELNHKSRQNISLMFILLLTAGLTVYVFISNRQRRKRNKLLSEKNILLEQRNRQITSCITYASFIQKTILTDADLFKTIFPEYFILFKPKDIVSGDFYWLQKRKDQIIIAVADCTGHGVPGAFMSMLGITFLREVIDVYKITQPDQILNILRDKVVEALHQNESSSKSRDGMDLAICVINTSTQTINYSGAYLPMMLYSKERLTAFKPNKMPIGFQKARKGSFTSKSVNYNRGDRIFLFTDGYADQFGGKDSKKYSRQKFIDSLEEIQKYAMEAQATELEKRFNAWKGEWEQIDDVTVVGIEL